MICDKWGRFCFVTKCDKTEPSPFVTKKMPLQRAAFLILSVAVRLTEL